MTPWLIASLSGLSFAGVGFLLYRTMLSGAVAYSGAYTSDTARQFEDLFLFIPPHRIAETAWIASALAFLAGFFLVGDIRSPTGMAMGAGAGIVMGGLALGTPRQMLAILRRRRLRRFNLQLVEALTTMSNALKAGFSITQAIESVVKEGEAPIAQEFDLFLQQTRLGISFSEALDNMVERVTSDDLALVVMAVETARKTGGNLTEVFSNIAGTIRERMRIETRIQTLTAQGRLQGIVVSLMPVVIALALLVLDPDLMKPFLASPLGLGVVAATIVLITLGGFTIRSIIRIDV